VGSTRWIDVPKSCLYVFLHLIRHDYLISLLATNTYVFAQSEYDPSSDLNTPPMTASQILMSREIKGWPLYTIVIALGQVSRIFVC